MLFAITKASDMNDRNDASTNFRTSTNTGAINADLHSYANVRFSYDC